MKYTIQQFRKDYPNDAACLDAVFKLRYGHLDECPACGDHKPEFKRVMEKQCYYCRKCYTQFYPCAGTIFEKTRTPLTYWFYAMYLMTITRNGVSAKELERAIGVTYKTAWRMAKLIRELMGRNKRPGKLKGIIEMDETVVGGSAGFNRPPKYKQPVFAMVERRGNVVAQAVSDRKKETLFPIIEKNVDSEGSIIMTDDYPGYVNLWHIGYRDHQTVRHTANVYRDGTACTNTVEGYFSLYKRMVTGTHIWVSSKHTQKYLDECSFRYNNRFNPRPMFHVMLDLISGRNYDC
jgi:transposase